jgi:small subunit ribosomal protein S6
MTKYELCVLLSGAQTEQENDEHAKAIDELLKVAEADVKHTHSLGRKKLAYTIKGLTHVEYRCWLFTAEAEAVETLNEKLRLSQFVVRHLIEKLERVSIDEHFQHLQDIKAGKSAPDEEEEVKEEEKKESTPAEVVVEKKPEIISDKKSAQGGSASGGDEKKVSLEDLDEKLDELLESDKI